MTEPATALLAKLEGQQAVSVLPRLRSLLESSEGRVLTSSFFHPPASALEPIWRVRLQISQAHGTKIDGLTELLPRLQAMPGEQRIEQFGVAGAEDAGNVFFDAETGELIGAVMVVMSEHTRAYLRGELKGRPFEGSPRKRKAAGAVGRRVGKETKVLA
jgi:hypothetical protein